jgi:hypothetical protein
MTVPAKLVVTDTEALEMDMTPDWIKGRVRDIEAMSGDDEAAHSKEDSLWEAVLQAIANGETADPAACAKAALETKSIRFERWRA